MDYNLIPIGISGVARSGKDTFCRLLSQRLAQFGFNPQRYALADELKKAVNPFLQNFCSIDIFTCGAKEKELVRDLLVAVGKIKREQSHGQFWTGLVEEKMREGGPFQIPIVTDIRFNQYHNDEVSWLKSLGGFFVHITRILEDGFELPPANPTEQANDSSLKECADLKIIANHSSSDIGLNGYVEEIISAYLAHRSKRIAELSDVIAQQFGGTP